MKKLTVRSLFKISQIVSKTLPIAIFLLLFISALLETISFLFFYPLFKIINGESISNTGFMNYLDKFHMVNDDNEVYVILAIIIGVFVLKFCITAVTAVIQNNYLNKTRLLISHTLFADIINREILFHGENNKNVMLNNLTSQIHELMVNGLNPLFIFFAESITLLLFVIAIVISIPGSVLMILAVSIMLIGVAFIFINQRVKKYGEERQVFEESRINFIQNSLNSILEIKIYEKEDKIISKYNVEDRNFCNSVSKQTILNAHSRAFIETMVVFVFIFITFYFVRLNPGQNIISSLGLLGVMVLRALPSINKVSNCVQFFKYITPIVANITQLLQNASFYSKKKTSVSIPEFKQVELRNIEYSYPGSGEILLNNVNMVINKNEVVGLRGESGTGKSTILNLIAGLINPQYGQVLINGISSSDAGIKLGHILSYVPQKIFIINDTLRNNIMFSSISNDLTDEQIWKVLEEVELATVIRSKFSNDLNVMLNSDGAVFSGGQRQRIGLARALVNNPQILVLDEATSGIDKVTETKIMQRIRNNYNLTVLFISHSDNLFEACDKIYAVRDKTLVLIKDR